MSWQARKLVEHAQTKGAPRFVLYIIADFSSDQSAPFTSFPRFDALVERTGYSKSTVSAYLKILVENGDLAVLQKGAFRGNGTVYRITISHHDKSPSVEPFQELGKGPNHDGERVQKGSEHSNPSNGQKGPNQGRKGFVGSNTVYGTSQTNSLTDRSSEWKDEWEGMSEEEWMIHLRTEFKGKNVDAAITAGAHKYATVYNRPFTRKASWRWLCREKQTVKAPPRTAAQQPGNVTTILAHSDPAGWSEFLRAKGMEQQPHRFAPQFLKDEFDEQQKAQRNGTGGNAS